MEQTFGDKLKQARTAKGLIQAELAKQLGVTNTTISNWEKNVSKPDLDMLSYICGLLNVKANYFLSPSLPDNEVSIPEFELIEKYRSLDAPGRAHVDAVLNREVEHRNQLLDTQNQLRQSQSKNEALKLQLSQERTASRFFAYYGKIAAAGTSVEFSDITAGVRTYPETDLNKNADYVIGVSGDSMKPEYSNGDIVYVQKTDHIDTGDIGIFQKGNNIYIKKAGEDGLISLNPDYPPLTADGDRILVLGKVLGKAEDE